MTHLPGRKEQIKKMSRFYPNNFSPLKKRFLLSLVMALTGLGFGLYSFRVVEGDNNAKRMTVILSIVALVLLLVLFIL